MRFIICGKRDDFQSRLKRYAERLVGAGSDTVYLMVELMLHDYYSLVAPSPWSPVARLETADRWSMWMQPHGTAALEQGLAALEGGRACEGSRFALPERIGGATQLSAGVPPQTWCCAKTGGRLMRTGTSGMITSHGEAPRPRSKR